MKNYNTRITFKKINTKNLLVDAEYQRELRMPRVRKILKNFNPLLANSIKVSEHSDGTYWVFDGQHTMVALKERNGGKDLMVLCKVYEFVGLSDEQRTEIEADLFAEQNGISTAVVASNKLRARYRAKKPEVIDFKKLTELSGLKMDFTQGSGDNKIVCHAEAYKAYKKLAPEKYVEMLTVIKSAWGGERDSLRAEIIGGMALLYENYGTKLNKDRLVRQLSKAAPLSIIRNGSVSTEKGREKYMVQMVRIYNKGKSANKL